MKPIRTCLSLLAWLVASGPLIAQEPPAPAESAPSSATDFDTRLKKNAFFKKILWTSDATYAPFEILIQKQAVPEPGFEKKVAQFFGPWLQQMAKVFEDKLATPAQLKPGIDPRPIHLIVLLSEGDFLNYSRTAHTYDGMGRTAFYDDRIESVVTYWEVTGADHLKRYPVLRRFIFALMDQRSSAVSRHQPPLWLREGISGVLAWHLGSDPATAFEKPALDPTWLQGLVTVSQDAARQNIFLLPLKSLVMVVARDDLWRRVTAAAERAGVKLGNDEDWYSGYLYQSILWVSFFRREGATAHNRAFENYLRAGMQGGGSATDLEKAFETKDLAALDQEFFRWVYAQARERLKLKPDEARLATLFAAPLPEAGEVAEGPALAARIAPPAEDPRVAHALALRKASHGDVDGALADLTKSVEAAKDDPSLAAMRTEIERLKAWKSARDAWLADLVANAGRLQIEREGKKLSFKVTRVENGVLQLETPKGKEELALAALEPAVIAGQMKGTPAGSPEWVRAYAMLLCSDARWEKMLKDKSPEGKALRTDAAGAYVELGLIGIAAEHLVALASNVAPADAVTAKAVLERLHRVKLEVSTQPLIVNRLEALRALARSAAAKLYDETHPKPVFAGKTNWIDDTTVELTYDFASSAELDDWSERAEDKKEWRSAWEPLRNQESERSFTMADGVWAGQGSFVFRHDVPFEAPMHIEAVLRHGSASDEEVDMGHFVIVFCDDGLGNYLACSEAGEVFVRDSKTGRTMSAQPKHDPTTNLGEDVKLEVALDREKVRYVHSGFDEQEQSVGSRHSGNLSLLVHTSRELSIESIQIRGKLGTDAMKALRERWIASALAQTGLE